VKGGLLRCDNPRRLFSIKSGIEAGAALEKKRREGNVTWGAPLKPPRPLINPMLRRALYPVTAYKSNTDRSSMSKSRSCYVLVESSTQRIRNELGKPM
jgi:hypothetical protein